MSSLSAAKPARPIILYRSPLSGHSHRVQMFMSLLSLPVKIIDVDLPNRAHKCPEFLATNPFGQVPVIDDNGLVLYDSNAILAYLARTYDNGRWMPSNMQGLIGVQQWFSLAAGPIYDDPCAARLVKLFGAPIDHERAMTISHNCSRPGLRRARLRPGRPTKRRRCGCLQLHRPRTRRRRTPGFLSAVARLACPGRSLARLRANEALCRRDGLRVIAA